MEPQDQLLLLTTPFAQDDNPICGILQGGAHTTVGAASLLSNRMDVETRRTPSTTDPPDLPMV
jgi:hypothetical protein